MRKSFLAMLVVAGMLAGCGGGGSSGGNSAPQLPAGPKTYSAAKASAGDYYVFKNLYREEGSNEQAYYSTRLVSNVAMNGTVSIKYLDDAQLSSSPQDMGSRNYSADFDALGRWLGSSNWRCGNSTNPPMYTVAPLTIAVGMNWEYSGVGSAKCSDEAAVQTTLSYKDNAVALELVTVPAGTFNTIKVNRNGVEEDDKVNYAIERSCWWEPALGVEVKCVTNETVTNKATGVKSARTETWELQGYSTQKLGRKSDSVLRFAGNWSGRYDIHLPGSDSTGTCAFTIGLAGNVTGDCSGAAVYFSVIGAISADGRLVLNIANGNPDWVVAGTVNSTEQISGSWNSPAGSGVWVVIQD